MNADIIPPTPEMRVQGVQIATHIFQSLGGQRFMRATNARIYDRARGVAVTIPNWWGSGVNLVSIKLGTDSLYHVAGMLPTGAIYKSFNKVPANDLFKSFAQVSGMMQ